MPPNLMLSFGKIWRNAAVKSMQPKLSFCQMLRFCTKSDSGDSNLPTTDQYIPQRIRRRLKDRNLTVDDLEYRQTSKVSQGSDDFSELREQSTSVDIERALNESVIDRVTDPEFPSDQDQMKHYRSQEKHAFRPGVDPSTTSILLFPGQGSQFVGMGKKILSYPNVTDLYSKASEILGYDLLSICLNGPKEKLDKTVYCQPAVLVTSLAAVERLKEEYPEAVSNCVATAGFSVGEYAALVFSGALEFEDAVHLVKIRAEAMQQASEDVVGGMLTVFCDHQTKLRTAMVAAREFCRQRVGIEEPVCKVANYLCTDCKVVAGHQQALDFLQQYGREWGIRRTKRLPVSGAFHTILMREGGALSTFYNKLLKTTFQDCQVPVHSNINGKRYTGDPKIIGRELKRQVTSPVMWEQTLHILYTRQQGHAFPNTYEVGPGKQMGALLRSTNSRAYETYKQIEV